MDPVIGGALIGGGASLIGGSMSQSGNAMAQRREQRMQEMFAKQGLRWRAEDATRAGRDYGINPLAMLGVQGPSYTPTVSSGGGYDMGAAVADMGQNIGRAVASTSTRAEKEAAALQMKSLALDVEGKAIDNSIRASTLRRMQLNGPDQNGGSGYLIPGQQQSGLVQGQPLTRTRSRVTSPHSEGAPISDVGFAEISPGVFTAVPSKDIKERIEDNIFQEGTHFIRNFFKSPPNDWLKEGERWKYSWDQGGYMKVPESDMQRKYRSIGKLRRK